MYSARNRSRAEQPAPISVRRSELTTFNVCSSLEAGGAYCASRPKMEREDAIPAAEQDKSTIFAGVGAPQSHEFERKSLRLSPEQYLPQRHRKDLIVLHFTAGTSCESAYRSWAGNPDRVATAFGVDPDGAIVEFFPAECWAYHLGIKGTHRHDQRSIGIEIANAGPLKLAPADSRQLNWWPGNWGARYCSLEETDRYHRSSFRGIDYFACMPDMQQRAVGVLVNRLCDQFEIPKIASKAARSGEFDPQAFEGYSGVATHSNFRRDKWDVGPAFDWDQLDF